jgi:hypothetical protein
MVQSGVAVIALGTHTHTHTNKHSLTHHPSATTHPVGGQAPNSVRTRGGRQWHTRTSCTFGAPMEQTRPLGRLFSTLAPPPFVDFNCVQSCSTLLYSLTARFIQLEPTFQSSDSRISTHTLDTSRYACHPTCAGQGTLQSPDWCGGAREAVEKATSAPCLCLQGFCGDLNPVRASPF